MSILLTVVEFNIYEIEIVSPPNKITIGTVSSREKIKDFSHAVDGTKAEKLYITLFFETKDQTRQCSS